MKLASNALNSCFRCPSAIWIENCLSQTMLVAVEMNQPRGRAGEGRLPWRREAFSRRRFFPFSIYRARLPNPSRGGVSMKTRSLVGLTCLVMAAAATPQVTLNNDSIEKMAMARLDDDVIVAMIQNQAGHYDLTPDTLIAMKREGISNKVLAALAAKGSATA